MATHEIGNADTLRFGCIHVHNPVGPKVIFDQEFPG